MAQQGAGGDRAQRGDGDESRAGGIDGCLSLLSPRRRTAFLHGQRSRTRQGAKPLSAICVRGAGIPGLPDPGSGHRTGVSLLPSRQRQPRLFGVRVRKIHHSAELPDLCVRGHRVLRGAQRERRSSGAAAPVQYQARHPFLHQQRVRSRLRGQYLALVRVRRADVLCAQLGRDPAGRQRGADGHPVGIVAIRRRGQRDHAQCHGHRYRRHDRQGRVLSGYCQDRHREFGAVYDQLHVHRSRIVHDRRGRHRQPRSRRCRVADSGNRHRRRWRRGQSPAPDAPAPDAPATPAAHRWQPSSGRLVERVGDRAADWRFHDADRERV